MVLECHKVVLSESKSKRYEKTIWRVIENSDMNNTDTLEEGNRE